MAHVFRPVPRCLRFVDSRHQVQKAYGSEGDKVVIVKRFDEGKSVLDVTPDTTEVRL